MSSKPGITLKKPDQWQGKFFKVKVDKLNASKAIGKLLIDIITRDAKNVFKDCVDFAAAIGIAQIPEEIAWTLIYSALTQAMVNLVEDNQDLFQLANQGNEINTDEIQFSECLEKLETEEITIYQDFFECPQDFYIVTEIKTPFAEFLQTAFNFNPAQAQAISNRLPDEFLDALYTEAAKYPEKYARLQTKFNNLFNQPAEQKAQQNFAWRRYSVWLQKQVTERMFLETFGLKQVYVPLRAYYQEKIGNQDDDEFPSSYRSYQREDQNIQRTVVELEPELQTWLEQADKDDAIRIISGGPGSGKSSFAKMFAAKQAEKGEIPVLFIPLHLFDPEDDLVVALGKFIDSMRDIPLPPNPLKKENFVEKLLIIFDGLDELAMQGKIAEEIAQKFISEVRRQVDLFNVVETRLLVLIGGREIVVQRNKSEFRKPRQILHVLPYFVDKKEIEKHKYIDRNKLLKIDQRQTWWQNYGLASGLNYTQLPKELDNGNLREITAQPLLNYLVAISYESKEVDFTENSNINEIYAHLLTKVYQRVWAKKNHNPHIQGVEEKDFIRILEGIAISAWHGGDVRVTTILEIEKYCDSNIIDSILNTFKQDKRASFTRLLTAFYFRQHGVQNQEDTFEFTHKSFGEYLAAKGIVRQLNLIHRQLKQKQEDTDFGWNEKQALENWAKICGVTAMDEYIFEFIVNEIRWQQDKYNIDVSAWQQTMCNLISYMLKHGMPMEKLGIGTFQEANRQARNAEEALLVVLNACARVTKKVSQIKCHFLVRENTKEGKKEYFKDFGDWISRLCRQRVNYDNLLCLSCLSYLDLQNCVLSFQDFYNANLQSTNLTGANLQEANLKGAILEKVNLREANLERANLERANLERANLERANLERTNLKMVALERANLQEANLQEAILEMANLQEAILEMANLNGTNLKEAILEKANLHGANLQWSNLHGTNLRWASLQWANLNAANLFGANLRWANLQSASLQWANLQRAILHGAILNGAILQMANLQGANLQGANLQGAILNGATLQRAKLQGAILERANLYEVNLQGAIFERANLQGANLQWVKLQMANLQGANLQSANLLGANLLGANLLGANLLGANLESTIVEWPRLLPANFEPDSE